MAIQDLTFSEQDLEQTVGFLNAVARHARFEGMKTEDLIAYFKLLAHMQQKILPKIEANIFEIKRVVETKKEATGE